MAKKFNLDGMLKVVADSWEQLRCCDIFRLLDTTPEAHRAAMARRIKKQRPELAPEVDTVLSELDAPAGWEVVFAFKENGADRQEVYSNCHLSQLVALRAVSRIPPAAIPPGAGVTIRRTPLPW
jgi:hypothetical protein